MDYLHIVNVYQYNQKTLSTNLYHIIMTIWIIIELLFELLSKDYTLQETMMDLAAIHHDTKTVAYCLPSDTASIKISDIKYIIVFTASL